MKEFDRFFELSPDLLCIAGFDGYFKKINPAVSKVLGYSEDELYARPINDFIFEHDKSISNEIRNAIRQSNTIYNFENRYKTKEGDIIWLSWTAQPVAEEQLVFAIAKNITYKKELEEERRELILQMNTLHQELKKFSLTTSHDLRGPLVNLMAIFELLDTSKIQDEETLELIQALRQTGESLKVTVNSFVDELSTKVRKSVPLADISLHESLNAIIISINNLIKSTNTTIDSDFSENEDIYFNKSHLDSIFLNLITNSIKYGRPGVPPVITITSTKIEGFTRLIYTDNGLGFEMDQVKDKLFGLNQTFHKDKDSKGIGLYLVHSHVYGQGGRISVESTVNQGTRFTIDFKDREPQEEVE